MGGGVSRTIVRYSSSKSQKIKSKDKENQTTLFKEGKKRVFISFHMENEMQVKLLRHQAKSDRFDLEFVDYSVKKPFNDKWKQRCEERINKSSVVICMIGNDTYKRPAVLWELRKAYALGKPVVGVKIYKDGKDIIPGPLRRNNAKIIIWDLKKIQKILDENKNDK